MAELLHYHRVSIEGKDGTDLDRRQLAPGKKSEKARKRRKGRNKRAALRAMIFRSLDVS